MTKIRLDFCDFWPGFSKTDNFFMDLLRARYDVEICDQPDFLIYSTFGHHHRLHTCPRIFFSGEVNAHDFRECDYAFTSYYVDDPRHVRLPLYVLYARAEDLLKTAGEPERVLAQKTKFCAFVVGNTRKRTRKRIDFFHRLSRYKKVDSGGRSLNNIGRSIGHGLLDKVNFLRPYKFNIAFENASLPGYTTEKILEAMRARCIPIYWGSPQVHTEFNPRSFLNHADFPSEEALLDRIIAIDRDDDLLVSFVRAKLQHIIDGNEVDKSFCP